MAGRGTHDRDHLARRDGIRRGGRDVGVDVADGDRDALGQAGPGRGPGTEQARDGPELADLVVDLVLDEPLEGRVEGGEVVARRVGAVLADALVAGGAGVAHVGVGELPDDPVGGLDPVLHRGVDRGRLLEQLQALGELPLRGDDPAVAGQPLLVALASQLGDAVGLALGGVVLPELDVGVRLVAQLVGVAQRGAVGEGGHHRAGGEVGGDADDVGRVDAGGLDRGGNGGAQHLDVVGGHLQRPVRRQPAARARHHRVDDTVGVLQDRRAQLGSVARPGRPGRGRTTCRSRRR